MQSETKKHPEFEHFIITPFYVKRDFLTRQGSTLPGLDWLNQRIELFLKFCLPSVSAQTNQNFTWLLFFDKDTPEHAIRSFEETLKNNSASNIRIARCSYWDLASIKSAISEYVDADTKWIVSTRLDNDDGIAIDFIDEIQKNVTIGRKEFLNFPRGYILSNSKAYLYTHKSNAFISLSEDLHSLQTPFGTNHELASEVAPVRQLTDQPMLFQIVHEKNVSNRVRGFRTNYRKAVQQAPFRQNLVLADGESNMGIIAENLSHGIYRFAHYSVREVAKKYLRKFRQ